MTTETKEEATRKGQWVLYDGHCRFCISIIRRYEAWLARYGFQIAPLQDAWVQKRLNLNGVPDEMIVLGDQGQGIGGADGVVFILQQTPWKRIINAAVSLPLVMPFARIVYRWVARNRKCLPGGSCAVEVGKE